MQEAVRKFIKIGYLEKVGEIGNCYIFHEKPKQVL
jgi:hypothetical protein